MPKKNANRNRIDAHLKDVIDHYPAYKDWTLKERNFFRELVRTQSPTTAAMRAYDCKNRKIASAIGCQNLKKLNIGISQLLDIVGLDSEQDAKDLKALRQAKKITYFQFEGAVTDHKIDADPVTRLRALELTQKMKGNIKENAPAPQIIDNSKHVHYNFVELKDKDSQQLTDILLGRDIKQTRVTDGGPGGKTRSRTGISR